MTFVLSFTRNNHLVFSLPQHDHINRGGNAALMEGISREFGFIICVNNLNLLRRVLKLKFRALALRQNERAILFTSI